MAHDADEKKVRAETDELSALGPEPAGPPAQVEEELMDESALAALSNVHRRAHGPKIAGATATAHDTTKRAGPGRQWWLALAIGIGVGAAASALLFSQRSQTASPLTAAIEAQPAAEQHAPERKPPSEAQRLASTPVSHDDAPPATTPPSAAVANLPSAPSSAEREPPPSTAGPTHAATPTQPSPHVAAVHPPSATPASTPAAPETATKTPAKTDTPPTATAAPETEEARLAAAAVRTGSDNPMDAVLDDAFTQGQQHTAQARAARNAAAALPVAPSRDDVIKTMTVLVPAIRGCAQGQSGLATAGMVVSNDGKVQSVNLTGQPFEGAASGRCMEGVVRRARFPHFQQPSFRVQFPFSLQ